MTPDAPTMPPALDARVTQFLGEVLGRARDAAGVLLFERADIRFPNMHQAMRFVNYAPGFCELRDPVTTLHGPVVLQVQVPGTDS